MPRDGGERRQGPQGGPCGFAWAAAKFSRGPSRKHHHSQDKHRPPKHIGLHRRRPCRTLTMPWLSGSLLGWGHNCLDACIDSTNACCTGRGRHKDEWGCIKVRLVDRQTYTTSIPDHATDGVLPPTCPSSRATTLFTVHMMIRV
jgi:hypothetical protein